MMGSTILAQNKIDTDSLLVKTYATLKAKEYDKAINMAQLGIKTAPDYLDFYVVLGRAYMLTENYEPARTNLQHVIDKNPEYVEAFIYLSQIELKTDNYENALKTLDYGIQNHPDERILYILKLKLLKTENKTSEIEAFKTILDTKYPNDAEIANIVSVQKFRMPSDRLGLNYTYTYFDREGTGPWHIVGLQYIRERQDYSIIGRVNYGERRSLGETIRDGVQFEAESYFDNNENSYSFVGVSLSNGKLFPKLKASYSYFQNFNKGWEGDIGIRYTKTLDNDIFAGVLGVGKYYGSYWFNLRSFWNLIDKDIYPAFTATGRYYFDSKFDYVTLLAFYGSSPDERINIIQFENNIVLDSYGIGTGYYKKLWEHYCLGFQVVYKNQEYIINKRQNVLEVFTTFQYKF